MEEEVQEHFQVDAIEVAKEGCRERLRRVKISPTLTFTSLSPFTVTYGSGIDGTLNLDINSSYN